MRPVYLSQTGAGSTVVCPLDRAQNPFNVGFGVKVTGTVNYTVQHTFDDIYDPTVTPTYYAHEEVASAVANADGNYAFAVSGIRLTVNSGTGTAAITIQQSGVGVG